ncbi:hypothetical protein PUNSTDRAFT_45565 [Punctularia strigosozonata HHB-11173 SS5]|uniref:uncharacterized protein n=1 Tax=Punctularia strigosozonata (strain HHB-11173) TaxID=741275 RepID=UPI000441732E|nr:uncharacterized protein PUNSTDRAFT_45565 [Punctularia strigosozonata HHB-11173 SS5]EIN07040.1 hypothetical protein PUNSTDRAFT_45565 [Punctularia strigosozonata HHB-11173 SS5]
MQAVSREEYRTILSSMDVDIPADSKLAEKALEKRLRATLKAAQDMEHTVPDDLPVNPVALPAWSGGAIQKASRRATLEEAIGATITKDGVLDVFTELRQVVADFQRNWDNRMKSVVVRGREGSAAINLRMVSVHALDDRTPLITVLYDVFDDRQPAKALAWLDAQDRSGGIQPILCAPLTQKLLLKMLETNSKVLGADYKPKKHESERLFKRSCLLPIGPVGSEDVGSLNSQNKAGCLMCGKLKTRVCGKCQSANYCSDECQTAHWPEHRRFCTSVAGGTWRTYTFGPTLQGMEGMVSTLLNKRTPMHRFPEHYQHKANDVAPPDVHQGRPFLVKLQAGAAVLVYDQQRSFQGYITRATQPTIYDEMMEEMKTGYLGAKIYRWAQRTGDNELTICLDRAPPQDPKW